MFDQETIDRFWSKVSKRDNGCWLWIGSKRKNGKGTGNFTYRGKSYGAHVFSYWMETGLLVIGGEIIIRHTCNNPPCVNPEHLIEGTLSDNAQDSIKAGTFKTPDNRGENHGMTHLTKEDVKEIKRLSIYLTPKSIYPKFKDKIGLDGLYRIINNRNWRDQ